MTMKLTTFLFFLGIIQMMASEVYSQITKVTLQFNDAAVKQVLAKIEDESEFFFLYNSKLVDVNRKVSIDVKDEKINEILNNLFMGTDVVYMVVDRQIVLTNKADQSGFIRESGQQPGKKITGKVTDQSGVPISGATVVVKGTTTGITTDRDGNFSLALPTDAKTLIFSFVGMRSNEVAIGSNSEYNVVLSEEAIRIDEIVAIGYGKQKKTSITAAVSTLQVKEISSTPIADLSNGLGGRLSGVIFRQNSGEPGKDAAAIYIRGISSIGSTKPLTVVDGIPRDFQNLDPNTIETITVLKDAAAVAPYGVAGANGVLLITTKRGKQELLH